MHPNFEKNGFLIAREFLDTTTVKILSTYFDIKYRIIKHEDTKDTAYSSVARGDVTNSYVFYSDHLTESVLFNNGQRISNLLGLNLTPTYTFARIYEKGKPLLPHTDRPSCEISASCPVYTSNGKPSVIYVSNFTKSDSNRKYTLDEIMATGDYTKVELNPGDALFYKGCERYHWRLPLDYDYLIQFFMHSVQADGEYREHSLDKRPYLGFAEKK